MAMSVGGGGDEAPMSDINTTPLVDVMLVLLIIFLIAVPVVIQTIDLALPKVQFEPTTTKPENVALSVTGQGGQCHIYWGMTPVTSKELLDRGVVKLKAEIDRQGGPNAAGLELPEVHIRGDVNTPYDLHDADGGFRQGRLHFRTRTGLGNHPAVTRTV
jgi:biopolymer transport protein ExbD